MLLLSGFLGNQTDTDIIRHVVKEADHVFVNESSKHLTEAIQKIFGQ